MRSFRSSKAGWLSSETFARWLVVAGAIALLTIGLVAFTSMSHRDVTVPALFVATLLLVALVWLVATRSNTRALEPHEEWGRFNATRFLQDAEEAAFIVNVDGTIQASNAHFDALVGIDFDQAAGRDLTESLPGPIVEAITTAFEFELDSTGAIECENRIGEWLIVELRYERFEKGGAQYFAFTMRDLTEMRRREIELATLAFQDSLTHLNNRAAIERRLARLKDDLAEGPEASFAVMVLDLDRFKTVNDSFGHSTGDQLLVEVAARIVAAVPRNAFVGRNGGDEFVVVVGPRATYATARQIAENIVAAVAKPYPGALHAAQVGASIGVALAPADGDDVKSLLDASDAAMYRAKRTGAGVAFANEPIDRLRSVA